MFFRLGEFALYTTQTRTLPLCRKPIISVSVHTFLLNRCRFVLDGQPVVPFLAVFG